jgi:hypothetical protein
LTTDRNAFPAPANKQLASFCRAKRKQAGPQHSTCNGVQTHGLVTHRLLKIPILPQRQSYSNLIFQRGSECSRYSHTCLDLQRPSHEQSPGIRWRPSLSKSYPKRRKTLNTKPITTSGVISVSNSIAMYSPQEVRLGSRMADGACPSIQT